MAQQKILSPTPLQNKGIMVQYKVDFFIYSLYNIEIYKKESVGKPIG